MMRELALVDQLRVAENDQARAALLLSMPDSVLMRDAAALSDIARAAAFFEGFEYVAARVAVLCAVRNHEGLLSPDVSIPLIAARMRMAAIAAGEARP